MLDTKLGASGLYNECMHFHGQEILRNFDNEASEARPQATILRILLLLHPGG